MRPVLLLAYSLGGHGGMERDAMKIVRAWRAQGRRVIVSAAFWDDAFRQECESLGAITERTPTIKRPVVPGQAWLWARQAALVHRWRRTFPDLLVVTTELLPVHADVRVVGPPFSVFLRARKQVGLPTWTRPAWRAWQALAGRRARSAQWLVVYSELARRAWERYGVPSSRLVRVIIPTDLARFRPGPVPSQRDLLLIGSDPKLKGIELTLRAWKHILHRVPQARLRIVSKPGKVPGLVRRMGLDRVEVLPVVPDPERYYREAWCVLAPSYFETWGNVVPEALACGVPVITTTQVPASELITSPEHGSVFTRTASVSEDAKRLAELMLRWLEDDQAHAEALRNSRRKSVARLQRVFPSFPEWMRTLESFARVP